jgi:hypothetical protein
MKALHAVHNVGHPEPQRRRGTSQMRKPTRESLAVFFESEDVLRGLSLRSGSQRKVYEIFR